MSGGAAEAQPAEIYRFRDNETLVRICIGLLYTQIVLAIASAVALWGQWELLEGFQSGAFASQSQAMIDAETSDRRLQLIGWSQLGLFLFNGVLILVWVYRANVNAWAMGAELDTRPGWAVGWFFVPFANLVMPFQAMKELWAGSLSPRTWRSVKPPGALFAGWWTFWLLSNIVSNVGARIALEAEDIDSAVIATQLMIAGDALTVPACILFAEIMRRIQGLQGQLARARADAAPAL